MKRILMLCMLSFVLLFSISSVASAGYVNREILQIVYDVVSDKNWDVMYNDKNLLVNINLRYVHIEGSKTKPKIDVWQADTFKGQTMAINRMRYYYDSNGKIQSKQLMITKFAPNGGVDYCDSTGIRGTKETVKEGTIAYRIAMNIYDKFYKMGYLNTLKK